MGTFSLLDYAIFIAYACLILFVGLFVSRSKGKEKNSQDYFLASKSLAWWAIGSSIIASNISAEQFIGMSGSGFAIGLGIASYEFIAAARVAKVALLRGFAALFRIFHRLTSFKRIIWKRDGYIKCLI